MRTVSACQSWRLPKGLTTFSGEVHLHFDNVDGFPYFDSFPGGEIPPDYGSGSETTGSLGEMDLDGFSGASGVEDSDLEDPVEEAAREERRVGIAVTSRQAAATRQSM